jgi:hypothetical protein
MNNDNEISADLSVGLDFTLLMLYFRAVAQRRKFSYSAQNCLVTSKLSRLAVSYEASSQKSACSENCQHTSTGCPILAMNVKYLMSADRRASECLGLAHDRFFVRA